jgi:hypothetical protein
MMEMFKKLTIKHDSLLKDTSEFKYSTETKLTDLSNIALSRVTTEQMKESINEAISVES